MSFATTTQPEITTSVFRTDGPPAPFGSGPRPGTPARVATSATEHAHGLLDSFQSFVYIVIVALFIITFTVQPFRIPSESMEPTLLVGDFLLVNKQAESTTSTTPFTLSLFAPASVIHRGDLIVFHYPIDPKLHLVKRVVGLPGDHLRLHDGHVFINGTALSEQYAMFIPTGPDGYRDDFPRLVSADPGVDARWWIQMHSAVSHGELIVPPDSYFVLGDNRNDSEDSRYWGFVPQANIVGKPFVIYFSLNSPAATPGQPIAHASSRNTTSFTTLPSAPTSGFARWDRSLRIIR